MNAKMFVVLVPFLRIVCLAHGAELVAVRGATVIRVDGSPPIKNCLMLIQDGRITSLGVDRPKRIPAGAEVIDLSHRYIIPGLIDACVFLNASGGARPRLKGDEADSVRLRLAATLYCGVTGIKVSAGPPEVMQWKRKVARGEWAGPRILACGPAITVAEEPPMPLQSGEIMTCETSDAVEGAIASLQRLRVDAVSVLLGRRDWPRDDQRKLGYKLLGDVVRTARARKLPVYVGVGRAEDLLAALGEGSVFMETAPLEDAAPEELLIWMARRKCRLVSGLAAYDGLLRAAVNFDFRREPLVPEAVEPRVLWSFDDKSGKLALLAGSRKRRRDLTAGLGDAKRALRRAAAFDVTVVAGSGAGFPGAFHGPALHRELALLVESGFTPLQALQAATIEAAKYLGWDREAGSLQVGKRGDFVVLRHNPLERIDATAEIEEVYLAGRRVERSKLRSPRIGR